MAPHPSIKTISVIGLGYVGLPVAIAFAEAGFHVIGLDVNERRIEELSRGYDRTAEITEERLRAALVQFTTQADVLAAANFHIVAVPTPVSSARQPDLTALRAASRLVGGILKSGDTVVFESTVYPYATEEVCVPALEAESGLSMGSDFSVGYSPERINPGDPVHRFETIKKVVSANSDTALELVASVYGSVVDAGVHRAPSIKVAEAAKVIENTQRDLNIALMNELAMIFDRLNIPTRDVLAAAGSKWNFLPFTPGLVGGHCIGIDPYYIATKALEVGYQPDVILAGRRTNEAVAGFISQHIVQFLFANGYGTQAKIGVFGATFKEDVPDPRNSKVQDLLLSLKAAGLKPFVHDPMLECSDFEKHSEFRLSALEDMEACDVIVYAVPHAYYSSAQFGAVQDRLNKGGLLVDIKSKLDRSAVRQDIRYWSL